MKKTRTAIISALMVAGVAMGVSPAQAHGDDYAEAFNLDSGNSFQYRFIGAGGSLYKSWLHPGTNSGSRDVWEVRISYGECATIKQVGYTQGDDNVADWTNTFSVRGFKEVNAHNHGVHTAVTDLRSC